MLSARSWISFPESTVKPYFGVIPTMDIVLHIEPGVVENKAAFLAHPHPSIALDGYLNEAPFRDGLHFNFDHHSHVSRMSTHATCGQVLLALRLGLIQTLKGKTVHVYVNDCDQDVCLSIFLLKNSHLTKGSNPLLNRLVNMADYMDAFSGMYPFPDDLVSLKQMMWVFQPYTTFRANGGTARKNKAEYEQVIEAVGNRALAYVMGKAETIELDTRYETLSSGHGWIMVREIGEHARVALLADGHTAFVSVQELPEKGRYRCTLCRLPYADFPLPSILFRLNEIENDPHDQWGGSDDVAGSPRLKGTRQTPQEIEAVVRELT